MFFIAESIKKYLAEKDKLLQLAHDSKQEHQEKTKALETSLDNLYEHILSSKFDIHGNITDVSEALTELCGYTKNELIGKSFCYLRHPDTSESLLSKIWKILMNGKSWHGEMKNITKGGEVFWVETDITPIRDEHHIIYAFESIMRSITIKKLLQEDIKIDPLTQLLNRRSFDNTFERERQRAKRDDKIFALLMIDVDFFKQYNDTYGHQKGDEALQNVAKVLKKSFQRSCDTVFRLGGEEFAVITSENSVDKLIDSANNACSCMRRKRVKHEKSTVSSFLTISIGIIAIYPDSVVSLKEAYKQSDKALYKAKENGRDQVQHFEL